MNPKVWRKGDTINIRVTPNYIYDCEIKGMGDWSKVGSPTLRGWLNHLTPKKWWDGEIEMHFIKMGIEIIEEQKNATKK